MHKREETRDKKRREVREKSAPPPLPHAHAFVLTGPWEPIHQNCGTTFSSSVMQRKKGVKALRQALASVGKR